MDDLPPDDPDKLLEDLTAPAPSLDARTRVRFVLTAIPFGVLAGWMGWIVHTFMDGNGWINRAVRLILDEFIVAVGLVSLVFLIGALFSPNWLSRVMKFALGKLYVAMAIIVALFLMTLMFVIFVGPFMLKMGLLQ